MPCSHAANPSALDSDSDPSILIQPDNGTAITAQSQVADDAEALWDAYRVGERYIESARRLLASPATEPQAFLSPTQAHAVARLAAVLERLGNDPELLSAMARVRHLAFQADIVAHAKTGEP